jgi:DNA repair exonuclease SbcCD ATPase subunit
MSSPHARELADVIAQAPQYETAAKSARKLAKELREHDATLSRESTRGELNPDALSRVVAECDRELEAIRSRAEEARGEQNLLEVAYPHLLHHPEVEACPLCLQKVSGALLSASVKSRLDVKLATELERLTNDERQSKKTKRTAEARLVEVKDLRSAHGRLVRDAGTFAESIVPLGLNAGWSLDADELFAHPEARSAQIAAVDRAAETTEQEAAARSQRAGELRDAMLQQEQTVYQPIEKRVNRVRDVLIPLLDAAQAIETHGRLRESAQERSGTFDDILREARDVAGRLKKIAAAVSEEEMASATAAVNARLPFVSGFFARVAGNPDFTGLDIQTTVIRNKVSYSLCATSTKMAALGDAVGHVLSEGDMSAAGMALLLGLASGESHQLGFLLLDDPAQGMDQNLQRNLARELAGLENHPQVIILTHQPDFAEALAANGAERRSLGHWEGGRLSNG